jgi:16S rRNA (guanine527-N7)-methyltransferase
VTDRGPVPRETGRVDGATDLQPTAPRPGTLEAAPPEAVEVFPDLSKAERLAALLAGPGVDRGVIGPREGARLWTRHLLNSAVLSQACPPGSRVVDLGSGGGLPGIPLALARPDLEVFLVEPLQRRIAWLEYVVGELDLAERVHAVRARAEDASVRADVVASRAVAPLPRLLPWSARLTVPGGRVVAVRGRLADEELTDVAGWLVDWGLVDGRVARFGVGLLADPTTAVVAVRDERGGDSDITSVPGPPGRGRSTVGRAPRVGKRRGRST